MSKITEAASRHLGASGSYAVTTDKFDSTLLQPMPRQEARDMWKVDESFQGFDTWHCYESTFLLDNGAPISGTLKFTYDAKSEFMVESKSMKLYLNSFDMCKMGKDYTTAAINYENRIELDLSRILKTEVNVTFHWINHPDVTDTTKHYTPIEQVIGLNRLAEIEIDDYKGVGHHLEFSPSDIDIRYQFSTNSLRSRCRHTKQKDTGTAAIYIKTDRAELNPESLFKQIVSLREVDEFHEFCAEKLYTQIMSYPEVKDCCVMLLYSRRGSLDINPVRGSVFMKEHFNLQNTDKLTEKTQGQ